MELLTAVIVASLLGSLHCAGMCGPLVAFAVGDGRRQSWTNRMGLQAAYHGGRLVTYAAVGGIAGLAGAAVDLGAARLGIHRAASIVAVALMIGVGAVAVLRYGAVRLPQWRLPGRVRSLIAGGQRAALAMRPVPRSLTVGLLTPLLPCGWLYLFALVAAGAGNAVLGMAVMTAFWLGTLPVLLSVGVGVQLLAGTIGRRMPLATAVAIVLLAITTIFLRARLPLAASEPPATRSTTDSLRQVEDLRDAVPPCCRNHGS
ncbi:MAG: sulfite exporter TauE/SafE family protein [Pirellulales bacterium]|nr:sulfite exporter TauE/SafE family protein [Pirellulales bacterium]